MPRIDRRDSRVIVIMGEGEIKRRRVWEAALPRLLKRPRAGNTCRFENLVDRLSQCGPHSSSARDSDGIQGGHVENERGRGHG